MIAFLNGTLLNKFNSILVIDVNGVGYEVTVTGNVATSCGNIGAKVQLFIYTDVKENAISLFGFNTQQEKEVFLLLKKVKGIGPRSALNVLSCLGAEQLLTAIGRQDLASLTRVPGIGKKSAERLIVELRENVGEFVKDLYELDGAGPGSGDHSGLGNLYPRSVNDAVLALEKLGFAHERAKLAVSKSVKDFAAAKPAILENAGELLKVALANL